MEQTWTIGELADAVGVSTRTIRHYEAEGLLTPAGRTDAGYRIFDGVGVGRLYRIVALRQLDLGIGAIRALLGAPDVAAALRETATRQLEAVDDQIDTARSLRARPAVLSTGSRPVQETTARRRSPVPAASARTTPA